VGLKFLILLALLYVGVHVTVRRLRNKIGCLCLSSNSVLFIRWSRDSPWESCKLVTHFNWKNIAGPVMKHYSDATDGSYIEVKETSLVWHYEEADPDFGSCQAKELQDHLQNVLANEPVFVKSGHQIVEVNPQVRKPILKSPRIISLVVFLNGFTSDISLYHLFGLLSHFRMLRPRRKEQVSIPPVAVMIKQALLSDQKTLD
jgi:hypothetical protein